MIGGATTGAGGPALGTHLVNHGLNESNSMGESRGVFADTVPGAVAELTDLARDAGHRHAIRHAYASPPPGAAWDEDQWTAYWALYEKAMRLEGCPFSEAIHDKPGADGRPPHRHRVYLALTERGTLVRIGHDYARQEAVSRITEHDTGAAFVKGAHNIRAATIARTLGRNDVADAMQAAGLLDGARVRADLSPTDRSQQDRTQVSKASVAASVAHAWAASDGGQAFAAALAEQGLRLAQGDKCAVVVDSTGNTHSLQRTLAMDARANGTDAPKAAAVRDRLDGMALPTVAQVLQQAPQPEPPLPDPPPAPGASRLGPPPDDGQAAAPPLAAEPGASAPAPGTHAPAVPAHAPSAAQGQGAPATASLDDAGPGPGEPPGPTASPEELAQFRARLAAYEDRKAAAWARWLASQQQATQPAAPSSGGGHHGTVQQIDGWNPAVTPGHTAGEAHAAIRAALTSSQDGNPGPHGAGTEPGHDGPGSREGAGHLRTGEGRERQQQSGRDPIASDDGARAGGERRPGGGEGAADGHCGEAGDAGRQAFQDRSKTHRAARSLHTLDLAALRDRLDPARVAVREAERVRADIDSRRAAAPDVQRIASAMSRPRTPWEQREGDVMDRTILALDRVMEHIHARDPITLAGIRQHGFHEVLREEGLRVLMDEQQDIHAVQDVGMRPSGWRHLSPE